MLNLRKMFGYGVGDMGLSISYFTVGFFFIYYLTDIVGLEPYLAGLAYFIGRLWDGINDPLIGAYGDRIVSPHGRKRVFLLFGVIPFALSFILLWMIPLEGSQAVKFIFATLALLVYTTLYSLISVPYVALVPVMTTDYDQRTKIIGIRTILSTLGTILGGGAALLVSSFSSELTGLRTMALGFGLFLLITVISAAQSVRGLERHDAPAAGTAAPGIKQYLKLLRDRNILVLMLFKFLGAIATGSLTASLPYFAKNILNDEGRSTIGLALYIAVAALFVPLWEWLARRYDKRHLLLWSMIVFGGILLATAMLLSSNSIPAFYGACALIGAVMSAYTLIAYSFPPDLVDYYEYKEKERHESVLFGFWQMSHQIGIALSGLLLGLLLQVFGYDGTQASQPAPALLAVRLAFGALPVVFMLLAVIVLQSYSITRGFYRTIRETLEQRGLAGEGGHAGT